MDDTLRVFKAVANERRLDMIRLLAEKGQLSLQQVAFLLDIPEATACRNLKILETAGIVKSTIIRAIAQYWLDRDMTELPHGTVVGVVLNESTKQKLRR